LERKASDRTLTEKPLTEVISNIANPIDTSNRKPPAAMSEPGAALTPARNQTRNVSPPSANVFERL
jgi:hypothetical protein